MSGRGELGDLDAGKLTGLKWALKRRGCGVVDWDKMRLDFVNVVMNLGLSGGY
jgi:hypothetical protein